MGIKTQQASVTVSISIYLIARQQIIKQKLIDIELNRQQHEAHWAWWGLNYN